MASRLGETGRVPRDALAGGWFGGVAKIRADQVGELVTDIPVHAIGPCTNRSFLRLSRKVIK